MQAIIVPSVHRLDAGVCFRNWLEEYIQQLLWPWLLKFCHKKQLIPCTSYGQQSYQVWIEMKRGLSHSVKKTVQKWDTHKYTITSTRMNLL